MTLFLSLSVTTMEVTTMWIKSCDGKYINSNYVTSIEYFGGGTRVHVANELYPTYIDRQNDIRAELVSHIKEDLDYVD